MHRNPQHGKIQPRLLQTYLFMKCEVMKKVLNPTSVNSNSSQQVSRDPRVPSCGTHPCQNPWEGTGDCATHTPTAGWAGGGHRQGRQHSPTFPAAKPKASLRILSGCW